MSYYNIKHHQLTRTGKSGLNKPTLPGVLHHHFDCLLRKWLAVPSPRIRPLYDQTRFKWRGATDNTCRPYISFLIFTLARARLILTASHAVQSNQLCYNSSFTQQQDKMTSSLAIH